MILGNAVSQMAFVKVVGGDILERKNDDIVSQYPASLTKLMTLKLMRLYKSSVWTTESVTVTSADVSLPSGIDAAGLSAGDELTWEQLAYAVILPSGSDACQCAARVIGDLIYASNGSMGLQGMPRFIQEMNAKASDLDMLNTLYTDPYGYSGPGHNYSTAHDLAILAEDILGNDSVIQAIGGTRTYSLVIAGPNARTLTLNNVAAMVQCDDIAAAKTGVWGGTSYNCASIWNAPSGDKVVVVTVGSISNQGILLDQKGILYGLIADHPSLDYATRPSDPNLSSVQLLASGFTDDSAAARTITATRVDVTEAFVAGDGSIGIGDGTCNVSVASDASLNAGSGDMTYEIFWSGPGFLPQPEVIFGIKKKADGTSPEWAVNLYGSGFNVFASANGSSWSYTGNSWDQNDLKTLFNGAPRHIAICKTGSNWNLWINGEKQNFTLSVPTIAAGDAPVYISGLTGQAPIGRMIARLTMGVARYSKPVETIIGVDFPRN